jgi:hypothetical protein
MKPIPGWPGYETDGIDFFSIPRTITRRDGVPYTVHGRKLKISAHRTSGAPVVKLSRGGAGKGRWCFVHLLLAATFGGDQKLTAPANFSAIRHGAEMILKPILIPGHLPSPTRSIRAGQTPANSITAGGGPRISSANMQRRLRHRRVRFDEFAKVFQKRAENPSAIDKPKI